ncbi:MAG: hypothetical protein K2W99_04035 [Chthoniobacterales bacterium]|nr:hypothetical protein [Chthoniobacterales bacterium]
MNLNINIAPTAPLGDATSFIAMPLEQQRAHLSTHIPPVLNGLNQLSGSITHHITQVPTDDPQHTQISNHANQVQGYQIYLQNLQHTLGNGTALTANELRGHFAVLRVANFLHRQLDVHYPPPPDFD